MWRRMLILVLLVMIVVEGCGQVFYSVGGRRLKGESYILFVDDMLPTGSLIGVKDLFRKYNRTTVVICEYAERETWGELQARMESRTMLSERLTEEERRMVDSVLQADCRMSIGSVERLKPAAIRMMWEAEVCRSLYARGEEDIAMDSYFQQIAQFEDKRVVALEDTVGAYRCLTEAYEEQLRDMVVRLGQGRNAVATRYNIAEYLYRRGDLRALAAMQAEGEEEIEAKVDRWIETIEKSMREERCFVVVYAKYVEGRLMEKLKKKGLKIKEVK